MGLKDDDLDLLPPSPTREPRRGGSVLSTPSVPHPASRHSAPGGHSAPAELPSSSGEKPPPQGADSPAKASQASQPGAPEEAEEEDWLSHTLSQKKSQGRAREQHATTSKGQNSVGAAGQPPSNRYGLGLLSSGGGTGQGCRELRQSTTFYLCSPSGLCTESIWLSPLPRCRHERVGIGGLLTLTPQLLWGQVLTSSDGRQRMPQCGKHASISEQGLCPQCPGLTKMPGSKLSVHLLP